MDVVGIDNIINVRCGFVISWVDNMLQVDIQFENSFSYGVGDVNYGGVVVCGGVYSLFINCNQFGQMKMISIVVFVVLFDVKSCL